MVGLTVCRSALVCLVCVLAFVGQAGAAEPNIAQNIRACREDPCLRESALSAQKALIDFSSREAERQLADLAEDAHEKTIVYLDWTIKNIEESAFFGRLGTDDATTVSDDMLCGEFERRASRPGGVLISGQPDRDNHHLLLSMTLDTARGAPFARVRCEYAPSAIALRLRGFFYVTDIRTATAQHLEFQPVRIPAYAVPVGLLEFLR